MSASEMDADDIILKIQDGKVDEHLRDLTDAVFARMRVLQQRKAREVKQKLEVGKPVKLGPNMKPKYLSNQPGKVHSFENSRILVTLDCGPIGKFRTGRVLCPLTALEIME